MPADFWELAWKQTWQVTLLAAAIATLVRLCGRNRPHLAHALWLAVLLKCVTPPFWSSTLGLFCWLQPAAVAFDSEEVALPSFQAKLITDFNPRVDLDAVSELLPDDGQLVAEPMPPIAKASAAEVTPIAAAAEPRWKMWLSLAAGLWLCGCLVWLAKTVLRSIDCLRTIRAATVPAPPELLAVLEKLIRRLRIRRRVRLVVSATRIGPAVIGLIRPTIVLPEVIVTGRPASELEPILAHELIHVRRGDLWVGCLQTLTCGLWWFHPFVRSVCRALAREAERCVDEELIAELRCDPAQYARALLTVLELKQTLRPVPVFPGMKPVEITSKRLERIMSLRQGCRNRTPWWCWAILLLVLAATLPGQSLVAVGQPPAGQDQSPRPRVERIERYYEVAELVEKFAQCQGMSDKQALEYLIERLPWHRNLIDAEDQATVRILAPAAAHDEIAAMLKLLREAPFDQVFVQATILSVPLDQVNSLFETAEDNRPVVRAAPASGDELSNSTVSLGGQLAETERQDVGQARMLAENEVESFWTKVRQTKGSEVLSRPQIRTLNGQASHIEVGQARSLVTGYEETAEHVVAPQSLNVREGLRMDVLPKVQADGSFEIVTTVELTTVAGVKRSTVVVAGKEEPIEMAIMSNSKTNVTAKVSPKRIMVLTGPVQKRAGEQAKAIIVLLKPRANVDAPAKTPMPVVPPRAESTPSTGQTVSFSMGALRGVEPSAPANLAPVPVAIDVWFPIAAQEPVPRTGGAATAAGPAHVTAMSAKGDHRELVLAGESWMLKVYAQAKGDQAAVLDFESRDGRTKITSSGQVRLKLKSNGVEPTEIDDVQIQADSARIEESVDEVPDPVTTPWRSLSFALKGNVAIATPKVRCTCNQANLRVGFPAERNPQEGKSNWSLEAQLSGAGRMQALPQRGHVLEAEQLQFSVTAGELKLSSTTDKQKQAGNPGRNELQTRSYAVADLVVPLPGSVNFVLPAAEHVEAKSGPLWRFNSGTGLRIGIPIFLSPEKVSSISAPAVDGSSRDQRVDSVEPPKAEQAAPADAKPENNLEPLQKLIETTVAPESWESAGGKGGIITYRTTLSLVVRQTPEIHQKIAELLTALRREQDVQVSLELKLIRFPNDSWTRQLKWLPTAEKLDEGLTLPHERAEEFRTLDEVLRNDHLTRFPKLTLFNEQVAEFLLPRTNDKSVPPLSLGLGVVVNHDRRGLRLNLACNATNREEVLSGARSFRLSAGESLLIDLGPEAAAVRNIQDVPMLSKLPHVGRLFKNVRSQAGPDQTVPPLLLLVTPRIVIVEEIEDRQPQH